MRFHIDFFGHYIDIQTFNENVKDASMAAVSQVETATVRSL